MGLIILKSFLSVDVCTELLKFSSILNLKKKRSKWNDYDRKKDALFLNHEDKPDTAICSDIRF